MFRLESIGQVFDRAILCIYLALPPDEQVSERESDRWTIRFGRA